MSELGIVKIVNINHSIEFYHVHTMKSDEQQKWEVGKIINTECFERLPSYNLLKKIKEKYFEKVRSEKFEQLPSRKNCLFLSPSLETAKLWFHILGGEKQLLKIRLIKGKYVLLDEKIYDNDNFTNEKMDSDAHDYWSGDEYIGSEKKSVLFEGTCEVIEEITLN